MKPWEFERLQPGEFLQLWDGWRWRQEHYENVAAFYVCHLLNIEGKYLKEPMSPKELLKPLREPQQHKNKREEDEKYLRELFQIGGE